MAPVKPVGKQAARPSWAVPVLAAGLILAGGVALSQPGSPLVPPSPPSPPRPMYAAPEQWQGSEPTSTSAEPCAAQSLANVERHIVDGSSGQVQFELKDGCFLSYKMQLSKSHAGSYAFHLEGPYGNVFTHTGSGAQAQVDPDATDMRTTESGTGGNPGLYRFTWYVEQTVTFHFTANAS